MPIAIAQGAGIDENTGVLEVGPGIGTLTRELCQRARRVVAVELDRRLPPVLGETLGEFDNFHLVEGDILKTNTPQLCREELGEGRKVACANLPYYITTPALTALVDSGCFSQITVMVQKEVAERLYAKPGTKDYGALSVWIQSYVRVEWGFVVGPGAFNPPPKVDSAVVTFIPLPRERHPADPKALSSILKLCFQLRRKQLQSILRRAGRDGTVAELERLGIAPEARPETLTPEQFQQLAGIFGRSGS